MRQLSWQLPEAVWDQLNSQDKRRINGTWQDSRLQKIQLKESMGNIYDKAYIGKEVYLVDFTTNSSSMPNNMIVYAALDNQKIIGYGYVD